MLSCLISKCTWINSVIVHVLIFIAVLYLPSEIVWIWDFTDQKNHPLKTFLDLLVLLAYTDFYVVKLAYLWCPLTVIYIISSYPIVQHSYDWSNILSAFMFLWLVVSLCWITYELATVPSVSVDPTTVDEERASKVQHGTYYRCARKRHCGWIRPRQVMPYSVHLHVCMHASRFLLIWPTQTKSISSHF